MVFAKILLPNKVALTGLGVGSSFDPQQGYGLWGGRQDGPRCLGGLPQLGRGDLPGLPGIVSIW